MRRNNNIYKSDIVMSKYLAEWLTDQSAVAAKIKAIESDSFEMEISNSIINVIIDEEMIGPMSVYIKEQEIFETIKGNLEKDQTVRLGSGQWTFYSEPEEQRLIIGERVLIDKGEPSNLNDR